MTDCPNCEYHRQRAQLWRDEAYKQSGHPLPEREQKPVAWMYVGTHVTKPIHTDEVDYEQIANDDEWFPVYLQPKRTWVGLTDEEKSGKRVLENGLLFNTAEVQVWELAVQWAEEKLKERNA